MSIGLPLVLVKASVGGDPRALGRIGKTAGVLLLGGLVMFGPIFVLKPELIDSVSIIVDATLNKTGSDSYDDRTATDIGALATVGESYGLGVGWGSYRSSSLTPVCWPMLVCSASRWCCRKLCA